MKIYRVYVQGFDFVEYQDQNASKARYQAYLALKDAGYICSFRDFLRISKVKRMKRNAKHF